MRIFNPDYHAPESKMRAALRKADLESHGYTKEVTTTLTSKPSNTAFFEKKHLYYKTVDCSRASEVVQELETLFSGNSFFPSSFSNLGVWGGSEYSLRLLGGSLSSLRGKE